MSRDYFRLTKDPFALLKPLLPNDTRGKPRVDDRRVHPRIIQVLKSGGRWIDAPEVYGPRKTLYNCFVRLAKPFCQGEAGAVGLSRMPMARPRR